MELLSKGVLWYVIFLLSTTFHEAAHAFTAMKLGDSTAYEGGQVSLNPLPHVRREPFGTVLMPLLSFFMSGWMIGWASTPYDSRWALRFPKRSALMSLAGPLANLLLVLTAALIIRFGVFIDIFQAPERITFSHVVEASTPGLTSACGVFLSILFSLNLLLFTFNLIPLPPLDGSGLTPLFLPEDKAYAYLQFINNPGFSFVGLVLAWKLFDLLFNPLHLFFINLLYPGMQYH
jgi:Zn-dependent protease